MGRPFCRYSLRIFEMRWKKPWIAFVLPKHLSYMCHSLNRRQYTVLNTKSWDLGFKAAFLLVLTDQVCRFKFVLHDDVFPGCGKSHQDSCAFKEGRLHDARAGEILSQTFCRYSHSSPAHETSQGGFRMEKSILNFHFEYWNPSLNYQIALSSHYL